MPGGAYVHDGSKKDAGIAKHFRNLVNETASKAKFLLRMQPAGASGSPAVAEVASGERREAAERRHCSARDAEADAHSDTALVVDMVECTPPAAGVPPHASVPPSLP